MGFDKHFYEDHCYLDDPTNDVGMNVEIIGDSFHVMQHNIISDNACSDKLPKRSADNLKSKQSNIRSESMNKCDTSKKAATHVYLPYTEFCTSHTDLFLHEDEKLIKPGDKFDTHDDFVQYLNENAKRWYFYYKCSDSRKPSRENESYTYSCVYLKNKEKYKKKGLRKRINNMKTDCPCKIKLRHLPNENELTVVYVCNHHDHELSSEQFCKLQHGRRLPPHIKEEIMDFLVLKVDKGKIKKYVEMKTGFRMRHAFFYALERNLRKSKDIERLITEERLKILNEKIAELDGMYGYNEDENTEHTDEYSEQSEITNRSKPKRVLKNTEHIKKFSKAKRKSKISDDVTLPDRPKKTKVELCPLDNYSETIQSVKNLQDSVKCEIQKNPWVSDQCVPVLPNRAAFLENIIDTKFVIKPDPETENVISRLQYCHPEENAQELINHDLVSIINDSHKTEESNENYTDIAYETVITDDNNGAFNETQDNVNDSQISNDVIYHDNPQETIDDISQHEFDSNQDIIEVDNVEYVTEDNENLVEYISEANELLVNETNEENNLHDVGVQTNRNMKTGHTLLPVFDVYMKDGNVTGFVVNDNLINGLKDGVDKGIQAGEDIIYTDTQEIENEDIEIIQDSTDQTGDTYTKHEYVHKYNIDQYMTQPNFPKYVDILAKETFTDVVNMFTNVYNENAMFKLTTTQKGKEGNTRIRYITCNGKVRKKRTDDAKKEKLGKNLHSIFVLKEKMRMLKKQNDELLRRNKYLEDVALKVVKFSDVRY